MTTSNILLLSDQCTSWVDSHLPLSHRVMPRSDDPTAVKIVKFILTFFFIIPALVCDGIYQFVASLISPCASSEKVQKIVRSIADPIPPNRALKYYHSLLAMKLALDSHPKVKEELRSLDEEDSSFLFHAKETVSILSELEGDYREKAHSAIRHLRKALLSLDAEHYPHIKMMLEAVSYARYTATAMYPYFQSFVTTALQSDPSYELPELNLQNLAPSIREANERLKKVPEEFRAPHSHIRARNLQGSLRGVGFDSSSKTNTPWVHSVRTLQNKEGDLRTLKILRHGTPTRDSNPLLGRATVKIIPEYKAFLSGAARNGEQVLYVNHQEYNQGALHSGESSRSRAIERLQEEHNNFHFISLPLDGPLWKEKYLENSLHFRDDVLSAISESKHGFSLPKGLPAEQIWRKVRLLYFKGNEPATAQEKKIFMLLLQSEIKDYLVRVWNISIMNITCKDDKDRGNLSKLVDMIKIAVQTGTENDPEFLRELFYTALGPFIIKTEHIISKRLELVLPLIEWMANLESYQKKDIRSTNEQSRSRVLSQHVPKSSEETEMRRYAALAPPVREPLDEEFRSQIESTVRRGNQWNLKKLKSDIEEDLDRMSLIVDETPISSFHELLRLIELNPALFDRDSYEPQSPEELRLFELLARLHQRGPNYIAGKITPALDPLIVGSYRTTTPSTTISTSVERHATTYHQFLQAMSPANPDVKLKFKIITQVDAEGHSHSTLLFI